MPRSEPPRRQRRYDLLSVLRYIARYQHQYPQSTPSQRRIQLDLQISAPSVVHNLLHRLERRGLLTITTRGRGYIGEISLTEAGWAVAEQANDAGDGPEQVTR